MHRAVSVAGLRRGRGPGGREQNGGSVSEPERSEEWANDFQVVHTANGEAEAHGIRATLEAAGVPVRVKVQAATKLFPVTVDGLGAVKILVPRDRLEEAREIIETPASPTGS
ncbi:MAG: hypothetical protein GF400_00030 [Candidatus Eisenbacteria bacterium]|nr:hypothetical protein [Candidatus Eisenbacteria bacterium]